MFEVIELGDAAMNSEERYLEGKMNAPRKDAKTVMDLLTDLAAVNAQLVLSSPFWKYNRTSRATEAGEEELPKFVESPLSEVSMRGLVFNKERPNVSIGITKKGLVMLPENEFGLESVQSHIHRNYTIIRDGIKNVNHLPVVYKSMFHEDHFLDFPGTIIENDLEKGLMYVVFDLREIPVVNRREVQNLDEGEFKSTVSELEVLKAKLKVLNHYIKEADSTSKIEGLAQKYGEDAAKWLYSIGVRDYGFSPVGTKSKEATDEYPSIQLSIKVKGLSSLPAINAVLKKKNEGKKLTLSESLIWAAIEEYQELEIKEMEVLRDQLTKIKRSKDERLARFVYTIILGRIWFNDTDESYVAEIEVGGHTTTLTVNKQRKMVSV